VTTFSCACRLQRHGTPSKPHWLRTPNLLRTATWAPSPTRTVLRVARLRTMRLINCPTHLFIGSVAPCRRQTRRCPSGRRTCLIWKRARRHSSSGSCLRRRWLRGIVARGSIRSVAASVEYVPPLLTKKARCSTPVALRCTPACNLLPTCLVRQPSMRAVANSSTRPVVMSETYMRLSDS